MNSEKLSHIESFEQNNYREIEQKFIPRRAELFQHYRHDVTHITQLYLSQPGDEYSFRLRRKVVPDGTTRYSATLKDRGVLTEDGLSRLEVEVPIAQETFARYAEDETLPRLLKERAEPFDGVSIDWIEGSSTPIIEIEDMALREEAALFYQQMADQLIERTGYSDVDNEALAYARHGGHERHPQSPITADEVLSDIAAYRRAGYQQLVVSIAGRSGSGKTTLADEVETQLMTHCELGTLRLSTDDYHVGKRHLETTYGAPWSNWEAAEVYDTARLARDIRRLQAGEAITRHHFDFASEEPMIKDTVRLEQPSDVIIVEGIQASSPDLDGIRQMHYQLSTPLATALGRDIVKRFRAHRRGNASIDSPEARLRYMLEVGERSYVDIPTPPRNVFSASVRSALGSVATQQP